MCGLLHSACQLTYVCCMPIYTYIRIIHRYVQICTHMYIYIYTHMCAASKLVPVKVVLTLFRTWWNGWCTARRFQVRHAQCLFRCRPASPDECLDSIKHYACCPVVAEFATRRLHLPHSLVKNMLSFLCLTANVDDETRALQMLLLHAVYSSTNCIRFAKSDTQFRCIDELLLQYVHQGASKSSFAQRAVHNRVTNSRAVRQRTR